MKTNSNKLFLISGHSGSGKSSLVKSVMQNELISYTTREPRVGEKDGKDYYFITKEVFAKMEQEDNFVESVTYSNNQYGITHKELENRLKAGSAFAIVNYIGMKQFKKACDNVVTIMLHTSKEDAMKNMLDRGDDVFNIIERMKSYESEILKKYHYDYCVLNRHGHFTETRAILKTIIDSELGQL